MVEWTARVDNAPPSSPLLLSGLLLDDARSAPSAGWIEIDRGRITRRGSGSPPGRSAAGGPERIISPGFIDAHVHLPQFPAIGCDAGSLLTWLEQAIFPVEATWADPAEAARAAARGLRRLAGSGTTGFAGFLTSHRHAVEACRNALATLPLRAIAGQAAMDRAAPTDLLGQPVLRPLPAPEPRFEASVNPRFAVACSASLLSSLGGLAGLTGALVHTHLAEQRDECALVARLFPEATSYTDVYDRAGLLGPRTLVAHALHLGPAEWALLAARGVMIAHCPTANLFLESGIFDLAAARRHRIPVLLGSDIAAGADPAMPRVARAMLDSAHARRAMGDAHAHVPTAADAWEMITRTNAHLLGWHDHGRLRPGDAADVLVIRPPGPVDPFLVSRLIYGWEDALLDAVVIDGRLVSPA